MTIKFSRAQRRSDSLRLKNKRASYWGFGKYGWKERTNHSPTYMSAKQIGSVVDTPTPCSCWMCGNPRKKLFSSNSERLTVQERKANEKFTDQIKNLLEIK